ncbi:adenylosuccinate synthase [bacterium]|nr:adenylosuccinate synthase [bacterium]
MPLMLVSGAQWGDEGKGKIVDLLTESASLVVRFQGGNNAGHTIVIGDKIYDLHAIPSGVLRDGVTCFIGNGVVLDPVQLITEIDALKQKGIIVDSNNLVISPKAHLIMPWHKLLDMSREKNAGKGKIGTTGKGIGPAYEDKSARTGLRVGDLRHKDIFLNKIKIVLQEKNTLFKHLYNLPELNAQDIFDEYMRYADGLLSLVADASFDAEAIAQKEIVLMEGAQGALLDIDHGTYPFVTSSNTVAAYASVGSGIGHAPVIENIALVKAYTTRVGNGPFPTVDTGEDGKRLQKNGHEIGTTTGRARDCGWLDLVALKYVISLNNYTSLAITKLDVLSGFESIKVATAYTLDESETDKFPSDVSELEKVIPIYTTLAGWSEDIRGITEWNQLPENAQKYLLFIQKSLGVPISIISTGPERNETISFVSQESSVKNLADFLKAQHN